MGPSATKQFRAARSLENVLVSHDLRGKIADFGLTREEDDSDYYHSSGGELPIRWTAPEALEHRKFNEATDVWSAGITLYEIWTNGELPYKGKMNRAVWVEVQAGYRLSCPEGCRPDVYEKMMACWNAVSRERISFSELTVFFRKTTQTVKYEKADQAEAGRYENTNDAPHSYLALIDGPTTAEKGTGEGAYEEPVAVNSNTEGAYLEPVRNRRPENPYREPDATSSSGSKCSIQDEHPYEEPVPNRQRDYSLEFEFDEPKYDLAQSNNYEDPKPSDETVVFVDDEPATNDTATNDTKNQGYLVVGTSNEDMELTHADSPHVPEIAVQQDSSSVEEDNSNVSFGFGDSGNIVEDLKRPRSRTLSINLAAKAKAATPV